MTIADDARCCWIPKKLEDICVQVTDGKHGDCQDEAHSGCYFLSCKDIVDGRLHYDGARQITQADFLDTHRRTKLAAYDVLITNSGTIGRMALVPEHELTGRTTFQKSVAILKPNTDCVDPRFLYYALQSDIRRLIEFAGGTAQKNLLLRDLRAFEVSIPPRLTQRRIAGILSTYDRLIENNKQRIRTLEGMARAIYREWFVNCNFPDLDANAGFESGMFGDLCQLVKKPFSETRDAELPLLDLARIPSRSIATADTGQSSELTTSRLVFESGDTLFGAIRCYLHKVVIAHFAGVTNTSVLVLRPLEPYLRTLVSLVASDTETIRWAETHSSGTKMPVINWKVLQTMPAPTPSRALAELFEATAGPMIDQIGSHAMHIQNLRRTRDLLLPRLLSEQIDAEIA